jgi:hypothetical protein
MKIHKKPSYKKKPHPGYIYEISEIDRNAKYLLGWPGYRTSQNKSGLGYIETQSERAHMQGRMLRWLFTGKFITHNLIYLLMMTVFGILIGRIPLAMLLTEVFAAGNFQVLYAASFILPYVAIGCALVINAVISLLKPNVRSITGD